VTGCPASGAADSAPRSRLSGYDPRLRAQRLDRAGDSGRQAAAAVRDHDRVRVRVRQIFEDLQADRPVARHNPGVPDPVHEQPSTPSTRLMRIAFHQPS
jgi:hypothetical protein